MMIITRMEDKVLRFKKFFDLNFPKVKTFAWQLLKSEEDAEDIAQDIFVKLWEKPDLWLEREKLDSYLYTVVRNHIYNFLKHKAVEYDYLDVAAEKMRMAELGLPTPDDEFCAHELELFVQMALERMPEQRRRVFLMSREEGMTSPEIAEKLNVSVRTVEQHIYKALQDLKKIILFFRSLQASCHLSEAFFIPVSPGKNAFLGLSAYSFHHCLTGVIFKYHYKQTSNTQVYPPHFHNPIIILFLH